MTAWPGATYRVQLTPDFGFDQAADVVGYLVDLGVTHLYSSPQLQAVAGSTHGYDVVDHTRVSDDLGGPDAHAQMVAALGRAGLGQVLDIVPNHMAIGVRDNRWWWDVLENGPSSVYASYFDVDWDPPESKLRNTVLMPILGDHYGRVLDAGELQVRREGAGFVVGYYEHQLPLAPRSLDTLLEAAAERAGSAELRSIAEALAALPPATATDRESVLRRHHDKEVLRDRLERLFARQPAVAAAVDEAISSLNADPDALDALLERQNYRVAFWRTAGQELDYRRFFDIATLAALRTEDPVVFEDTHRLVLDWVRAGVVDGLRVDHPDGLRDPDGYLRRLAAESGETWVAVEKILEPGERLPSSWPTAGTTGYDFLARVGGLFVDPSGEGPLTDLYAETTGEPTDWHEVVVAKKHDVMREVLASDVTRLTAIGVAVCERHRHYRDYTRRELNQVVREFIACLPVYRTYLRPESVPPSPEDEACVAEAVERAVARRPDLDPELFALVRRLLLGRAEARSPEAEFVARLQQLSGAVMAKGVEDTAFYTFNRFVALNEVGGDPGRFGTGLEEFHRACEEAQRQWPAGMLATSTHDTKRSEDVRARLALLSEIPDEWSVAVRRWLELGRRHQRDGWPDANAQYLFFQTLVGAWPLPLDRAAAYMAKATKEAKQHTSWLRPDEQYDAAVQAFVEGALADDELMRDVSAFVAPLVAPGRVNSLAQALLRLTAPGVADTYQGTELWDLSLVDPDNRRPVDYGERRRLLADVADGLPLSEVMARSDEGLPKLLVTTRALQLRRRRPEAFGVKAAYRPLRATGPGADHVVAFTRREEVVTVVPRLVLGVDVSGGWADTSVTLPGGSWEDVVGGGRFEGGPVGVADLLRRFPVALLERV